jgi:hypothetical protein
MNRRNFFARTLGLFAAAAVAPVVAEDAPVCLGVVRTEFTFWRDNPARLGPVNPNIGKVVAKAWEEVIGREPSDNIFTFYWDEDATTL